jgi:hypothetical protein
VLEDRPEGPFQAREAPSFPLHWSWIGHAGRLRTARWRPAFTPRRDHSWSRGELKTSPGGDPPSDLLDPSPPAARPPPGLQLTTARTRISGRTSTWRRESCESGAPCLGSTASSRSPSRRPPGPSASCRSPSRPNGCSGRVHAAQAEERRLAGSAWRQTGFVFTTEFGEPCDPRNPSGPCAPPRRRPGSRTPGCTHSATRRPA